MPALGHWTYSVNRDATAKAYAAASRGGADTCTCAPCRNFRLAREQVYPAGFRRLLDELGVDVRKDAEVYHCGRVTSGLHVYGGWFHFVGRLQDTGDFAPIEFAPGFRAHLARSFAPGLLTLKAAEVVQLEFECEAVPWLLEEPEPD